MIFNEYFNTNEYTDGLDDEIDDLIYSVWNKNGLNFYNQNIALWYIKTEFIYYIKNNKHKFDCKINKLYYNLIEEYYDYALGNFKEIKEKFYEEILIERRTQLIQDIKNKISK